ncbi:MAG: hypothetical protein LBF41_01500 [Deltaproteobacteria bacterium]|nr:hypothetical protein [Deltaproteobacteria bacterium]
MKKVSKSVFHPVTPDRRVFAIFDGSRRLNVRNTVRGFAPSPLAVSIPGEKSRENFWKTPVSPNFQGPRRKKNEPAREQSAARNVRARNAYGGIFRASKPSFQRFLDETIDKGSVRNGDTERNQNFSLLIRQRFRVTRAVDVHERPKSRHLPRRPAAREVFSERRVGHRAARPGIQRPGDEGDGRDVLESFVVSLRRFGRPARRAEVFEIFSKGFFGAFFGHARVASFPRVNRAIGDRCRPAVQTRDSPIPVGVFRQWFSERGAFVVF